MRCDQAKKDCDYEKGPGKMIRTSRSSDAALSDIFEYRMSLESARGRKLVKQTLEDLAVLAGATDDDKGRLGTVSSSSSFLSLFFLLSPIPLSPSYPSCFHFLSASVLINSYHLSIPLSLLYLPYFLRFFLPFVLFALLLCLPLTSSGPQETRRHTSRPPLSASCSPCRSLRHHR